MKYVSGSIEFANTVAVSIEGTLVANNIVAASIQSSALDLTWNSDTDTYSRSNQTIVTQQISNVHNKMRRCILNDSGQVVYYLNSANSNIQADGVTPADLSGASGQVMVEIPQTFVKYTNSGNTHTWSISDIPLAGYELHPAFIVDNVVVEKRYIGAYDACVANTVSGLYESGLNWDNNITAGQLWNTSTYKLSSVSGVYPAVGAFRSQFRSLAANRGTRWRQLDFPLLSLLQLLYLVEYGNFNSQAKIGNGNTGVSSGYPASSGNQTDSPHSVAGKSNSIGNGTGGVYSTTRDTAWMSYRGIENFFGNCWTAVDGINFNDGLTYINNGNIRTNYADDTATNYRLIGSKIQTNGYPSKILTYPFGFIPTSITGGTSTAFLCDYYYQSTGWRVLFFGGDAYGGDAGVFYLLCSSGSADRGRSVGARLVY